MCQLNLNDFPGADDRERFAVALAETKKHPGSTLLVPPGVYHITTDLARQTMNNAISGRWGENPEDAMFSPDLLSCGRTQSAKAVRSFLAKWRIEIFW